MIAFHNLKLKKKYKSTAENNREFKYFIFFDKFSVSPIQRYLTIIQRERNIKRHYSARARLLG